MGEPRTTMAAIEDARVAEITAKLEEMQTSEPAKPKGRPTDEEKEALTAHGNDRKEYMMSLNEAELAAVSTHAYFKDYTKKGDGKQEKKVKEPQFKKEAVVDPEAEAKKLSKLIKNVEKEGGKKGVEIEGAADMGGLAFFCTTLMEPDGNLEMLEKGFACMNAEPNPDPEEERRGGAGGVGKMVFSAGAEFLQIVCNMPEELQVEKTMDDAPTREAMFADVWVQHVLSTFEKQCPGLKCNEGSNGSLASASIPADKEKAFFPLKIKDDAMAAAYALLTAKHCMKLSESSEGECFGDFEDTY